MPTECNATEMDFGRAGGRRVVANFDGGMVSSDAGALLLGATDQAIGLTHRFAGCFSDRRNPLYITHTLKTLVGQRVFGLALGYEDLIDHDELRHDPVLGVLLDKLDRDGDEPAPLAGKSTLNRLEHVRPQGKPTRYHRIDHDAAAIERLFVELFLDVHGRPPRQIVLDLDATDDPLHGHQEGRFFHGYYDCYCYLPLYVFCGRHLLAAKLRRSNIDASAGAVEEITRIVAQIRARWPGVKIVLRADSGFAREALMAWCEANRVDYVFGLARNERLEARIAAALAEAQRRSQADDGRPARVFREFLWSTKESWSRRRRVIAKAEWTQGEGNPRFIVTSLKGDAWPARPLYEELYCARGEMENRIKECQTDLFADRTSTATMRANQLRLWFASMAYVLLCALRRIGLAHTQFAAATCGTIRLKLLKLGALVKISARRIKIAFASACPFAQEWRLAAARLARCRSSPA
jgi:Transposase DDE domain group 1